MVWPVSTNLSKTRKKILSEILFAKNLYPCHSKILKVQVSSVLNTGHEFFWLSPYTVLVHPYLVPLFRHETVRQVASEKEISCHRTEFFKIWHDDLHNLGCSYCIFSRKVEGGIDMNNKLRKHLWTTRKHTKLKWRSSGLSKMKREREEVGLANSKNKHFKFYITRKSDTFYVA